MTGAAHPGVQRVLFVCLGNICRSPTAEGVFAAAAAARGASARFEFDSAGTGGWHQGDPPDPRAVAAAARRGVDLSALRARQVTAEDFDRFDLILAMDRDNLETLKARAPSGARAVVAPITQFGGKAAPAEIGDPYYGGAEGFERVLDLLERCAEGMLDALSAHGSAAAPGAAS